MKNCHLLQGGGGGEGGEGEGQDPKKGLWTKATEVNWTCRRGRETRADTDFKHKQDSN